MLTKTDFLLYLEAPMHLWAKINRQLEEVVPSDFERQLMEQGKVVEKLAVDYLKTKFSGQEDEFEFGSQRTFIDGDYQARVDAWVLDKKKQVYDIYEVKSSTSLKTTHKYELAFQYLVVGATVALRDVYAVYVNKTYVKVGNIDFSQFFVVHNAKEEITELVEIVKTERAQALQVSSTIKRVDIIGCRSPKECPCPKYCHPDLPTYPIYDLARLTQKVADDLVSQGIFGIRDIPDGFQLNESQAKQVMAVKTGVPVIDAEAIATELQNLEYPIYFLDYEAYSSAIPRYDGQSPYNQVAFQYSLHILEAPGAELKHREYLMLEEGDAGRSLVTHMAENIGKSGSVIVWSKSFEATRNKEMAKAHPEYSDFLTDINNRIFDLMEIFSKGHYVHRDFHGSASIKKVLPVLVSDLQLKYGELLVPDGTEAMQVWNRIVSGELTGDDAKKYSEALLIYCGLDTMAMVKVFEVLLAVTQQK